LFQHYRDRASRVDYSHFRQPLQFSEMQSASIHRDMHATAAASVSFPEQGLPSHAPQAWDIPNAASVRPYEGSSCIGPNVARRMSVVPYVDGSSRSVVDADALGAMPVHQSWDDMVGTAYASRAPLCSVPVHPWPSSAPARIQPVCPTINDTDTSSIEPSALPLRTHDRRRCR